MSLKEAFRARNKHGHSEVFEHLFAKRWPEVKEMLGSKAPNTCSLLRELCLKMRDIAYTDEHQVEKVVRDEICAECLDTLIYMGVSADQLLMTEE